MFNGTLMSSVLMAASTKLRTGDTITWYVCVSTLQVDGIAMAGTISSGTLDPSKLVLGIGESFI
jgi:hypothetical protein